MNEILNISGNINSTKKTDHIMEMPGLREFCFKNHIYQRKLTTECHRIDTVMFGEHPLCVYIYVFDLKGL